MNGQEQTDHPERRYRVPSDAPFLTGMLVLSGIYVVLIVALLLADVSFTTPHHFLQALKSPEIRYSIKLSLVSCSLSALMSLWVAVPIGYLMSRFRFRGRALLDAMLDIPIVLPPLVLGLSLLILFQAPVLRELRVAYAVPGVILAQFAVGAAFSVRTMRTAFDQINPRQEQVALTLGCSRGQAFWMVALPNARNGILAAFTLAWARALGEFGPILVFCGATRMRTEVMPTSVFLELTIGNIEMAVAVSLMMVLAALTVLLIVRGLAHVSPYAGLRL